MAKKRPEDPPKGAPAWQSTFSDLMNLLLCFFVLLFSMSTVDAEKFEQLVASLQNSFSILPAGGSSIGDGEMISAGVSQLEFLDSYYNDLANSKNKNETENNGESSLEEEYKAKELSESEKMAENIEEAINKAGIQNMVEVNFNAEYVQLSLSGAVLFESGKSELVKEAYPVVKKIAAILENYDKNIIEIEGHTDNVPMHSAKYEDNNVLSMYRALSVADYIRSITKKTLNPAYIKSSGRGEYVPVADNDSPEGRSRNRRVEIKIFNSYNSNVDE